MNYILFDDYSRNDLLPFTYTRPVSEIRIGILTITEKWEKFLNSKVSFQTQDFLSSKYKKQIASDNFYINGKICPNKELLNLILNLKNNSAIKVGNDLVAFRTNENKSFDAEELLKSAIEIPKNYISVKNVWDVFSKNSDELKNDFELLTYGKKSQKLSSTNTLIGEVNQLFIEEGAIIEAAILNVSTGPIYIGKDAEVMEGSIIRGPFSLGEHSALKLGTKIYGATTIGPHCKVGGEVNNSVIFGFTNKAHDGFLGNSVIGEWCNLGADTNNSNLKNNYGNVKIFNYSNETMKDTQLQFCGLMMGDHSKCGINTMFNTGTVVGVAANIFGGGFPSTHIPSFTWGGADHVETYKLDKMFETAERVYARRGLELNKDERTILTHIFSSTEKFRK
jgi:UDP-N-acetylglucosamine diphosphorylase/glucosamine-1-phosphate N-acetyltransferase